MFTKWNENDGLNPLVHELAFVLVGDHNNFFDSRILEFSNSSTRNGYVFLASESDSEAGPTT